MSFWKLFQQSKTWNTWNDLLHGVSMFVLCDLSFSNLFITSFYGGLLRYHKRMTSIVSQIILDLVNSVK